MVIPRLKRRTLVTPKKGESVVALLNRNFASGIGPGAVPKITMAPKTEAKAPSAVTPNEMVSDLLTLRDLLGDQAEFKREIPVNPLDQRYPWTGLGGQPAMTPREVYKKRAMDLARDVADQKSMRDQILARAERENADEAVQLLSPFLKSEPFLAPSPSMVAPPTFPGAPERERNPQMGGLAGLGGALAGLMVPEAAGEIATGQKKQAEGMAEVDFQNAVAKWDTTLRNMTMRYEAEKEHEDKVRQVNQFNAGVRNANISQKMNAVGLYSQAKGDQRRTTALEDALKKESAQAGEIAALSAQVKSEEKYIEEVEQSYRSMLSMARGGNTAASNLLAKMLAQTATNQRQGKQMEYGAGQGEANRGAALQRTNIMGKAISTRQGSGQQFTLDRDEARERERRAAEQRAEDRQIAKEQRTERTKSIVQRNKAALADLEEAREEAKRRLDQAFAARDALDKQVDIAPSATPADKAKRQKLIEARQNAASKEKEFASTYNRAKAAYEKKKKELEAGVKPKASESALDAFARAIRSAPARP